MGEGVSEPCSGYLREGVCYESSYGARGCRAYDIAASDECQVAEPPSWCADRFCWVAPWDCLKPHEPTVFFADALVANSTLLAQSGLECNADGRCYESSNCTAQAPANRLFYSYQTCGNVDAFTFEEGTEEFLRDVSSRGKLRITIPGDEPPYLATVGANESYVEGTARRDGAVVRFAARILAELGLEWEEVPITPESRHFSPSSSFTACTHDVALNNTDICVGSVWPFENRRRLTAFAAPLKTVTLHIITTQDLAGSQTLTELLGRPFKPFTLGLWVSLILTLMYAGYALYTLDATGYDSDDDEDHFVSGKLNLSNAKLNKRQKQKLEERRKNIIKQIKYEKNWLHAFCPTTVDDLKDVSLSMAYGVHAYLSGGEFRHEPKSAQSWTVFVGFSFLVLVITSNYTAQVTSFSVLGAAPVGMASLADGIKQGKRFCGWASMQPSLEAAYPDLRGLYVPLDNGHDCFQAMDDRLCDAAIIDDDAWEVAKGGLYSLPEHGARYAEHAAGAARYHCDTKVQLPGVIMQQDIAFPVRDDLQRALSWRITKSKNLGEWHEDDIAARRRFVAPSQCEDDVGDEAVESMDISTGAGVIIISLFLSTLGLLMNSAWRCSPAQKAKRREWLREYAQQYEAAARRTKAAAVEQSSLPAKGTLMHTAHLDTPSSAPTEGAARPAASKEVGVGADVGGSPWYHGGAPKAQDPPPRRRKHSHRDTPGVESSRRQVETSHQAEPVPPEAVAYYLRPVEECESRAANGLGGA